MLQSTCLIGFLQVNKIDTLFDPTGRCTDMTYVIIVVLRKFMVTKHRQKRMDVNSIKTKAYKDKAVGRITKKKLSQFYRTASTCNHTGSLCPHILEMKAYIMSNDLKDQMTCG